MRGRRWRWVYKTIVVPMRRSERDRTGVLRHGVASEGRLDRRQEIIARCRLEKETCGPSPKCFGANMRVILAAKHNHASLRRNFTEFFLDFEAMHERHPHVHHDQTRAMRFGFPQEGIWI